MQSGRHLLIYLLIVIFFLLPSPADAQIEDFFKGVKKFLGTEELTDRKIVDGLKEALQLGTNNTVMLVSKINGYYKNPEIKIPLPDKVMKVEKILRAVGYGPQIEAFELSMNRAAERAAPKAKALFWEAIKKMTITDARKILKGRDNEATLYFREKTQDQLTAAFKPIIHAAMSEVGVTRSYQQLTARVSRIPFTKTLDMDLDKYVTDRALDGLFLMLAEEERRIRRDPAARVTETLKEVFGGK
ncbi:MAG: DUF4197 domain-containing protein [Deltaproteobacteria bacterium]|nr:DUF4197 domain-containing protein [Deltaproteobacteria bacterium]